MAYCYMKSLSVEGALSSDHQTLNKPDIFHGHATLKTSHVVATFKDNFLFIRWIMVLFLIL